MRRTILTLLVNCEVPRMKKSQKFTFGSDGEVCCVPVCGIGLHVPIESAVCFFGGRTRKVSNPITCIGTEKIHTETCKVMLACPSTRTYQPTVMCSLKHTVYYPAAVGKRVKLQVRGRDGGISWLNKRLGHLWKSVASQRCKNKEKTKGAH